MNLGALHKRSADAVCFMPVLRFVSEACAAVLRLPHWAAAALRAASCGFRRLNRGDLDKYPAGAEARLYCLNGVVMNISGVCPLDSY